MKKRLKHIYNLIDKTLRNKRYLFSDKLYLSFGENCLTDNILARNNLKSFATIYSHSRSNIEYILQMEKDNYRDLFNLNYIKYEELNGKLIPRLKTYNKIENSYNTLHINGFEFTHHDVIKHEALRDKLKQRVERLNKYNGQKKIIIIYHHRVNSLTDINKLLGDLSELKSIYSRNKKKSAEVIFFTQKIISNESERKLEYKINNEIHMFIFNTLNIWEGDVDDILWARCDDDLIKQMIEKVKKIK